MSLRGRGRARGQRESWRGAERIRGRGGQRGRGRQAHRGRGRGTHRGRNIDVGGQEDCPQTWKTVEQPDEAPPTPRFFPKRTPGVQPPLDLGTPQPGEIFSHFFDDELLQVLVGETNKKALSNTANGKKFRWKPVTKEELRKFIGVLLYMSVLNLPKLRDYWRKGSIFSVNFSSSVMSRDRFRNILSNLNMTDPEDDAENASKRGTEEYDPLQRVRQAFDLVRIRCKSFYHPRQNLAVDERMVATKARLSIKQYMKAKPTKWGVKLFVLADVNGYTIDNILYAGRFTTPLSSNGLAFDVVDQLVRKEFLGSGYIIYTDNFYTSPLLFRHLVEQGFGVCGTYRDDRVGVPKSAENALTKSSPRGDIRWLRDRSLLFVKWKDTRLVSLCSSIHTVYSGGMVQRWEKKAGKYERVTVPRPDAVAEYNNYMGGVDTSDQLIGTNTVKRKTKRWTTTIFQHLVDICVTNSYIIHKEISAKQQQKHLTCQAFQESLAESLLEVPVKSPPPKSPPKANPGASPFHCPVAIANGQPASKRSTNGRLTCRLCKKCTPWKCELCNTALCLQPDRNCFRQFHLHLLTEC